MTLRNLGKLDWGGGRDADLHRNYWVKFLIESTSDADGPQTVTFAPGLPLVGSSWGYGNDNDAYALCQPTLTCETIVKNEPNFWWVLKYDFSTRPWRTCCSQAITNPLSQPMQLSGSFVTYQERMNRDRNGKLILSSCLEPVFVQVDKCRPAVSIVQTVLNLGLSTFSQMINTLNDAPLWGLQKRCVKLRNVPWRRLNWGLCTYYYQRTLEFDVNYDTFDETKIHDVGTRVVDEKKPGYVQSTCSGTSSLGSIDRKDPKNFKTFTDGRGVNIGKVVPLNLHGELCTDPANHNHYLPTVEKYGESNLFVLGVPASL
jgi:hypothetical protein